MPTFFESAIMHSKVKGIRKRSATHPMGMSQQRGVTFSASATSPVLVVDVDGPE